MRTLPGRIGRTECTQEEAVPQTKSKAAFTVLSEFYACSVGVWDRLAGSHSSMAPVSPQEAKCICAKLCHLVGFLEKLCKMMETLSEKRDINISVKMARRRSMGRNYRCCPRWQAPGEVQPAATCLNLPVLEKQ